ncbi:ComEC/Rec2 family competence protein [Ornithinibacillus bavariensis]|uniref:Competence protein ComE n=1 Tax=Ornithinibacillus bavariensis TaxID=545502 RepID=A0A920C6F6_9BACI|nr:ComEC/Rec2 family competence protein [Ornithinibacillus bavariensis]GIO27866.1 competence protein ComE [Ornithinibacillus bavariensis]HAM80357.1 competence protein [Ornithinibacillus sp.]
MLQYKRLFALIMLFFLVFAAVDKSPTYAKQLAKKMDVHFINVGQGDSIFIKTPNGKNILIDAGPPRAGKIVVQYLKGLGVDKLHLVIATHPDRDHIGGLPAVLNTFEVEHILDSGKLHVTRAYASYMNEVRRQEIPMTIAKVGKHISIDPLLDFRILNGYGKRKSNNQSSIALKLSYNDVDFLFLGDIEDRQEKKIAQKYDVRAEIIKIAHHGSKTSSSSKFLEEVDPSVAIISYSKFNRFGHPVNRVIEKLIELNTHIYSTAAFGDLVIYTEGKNYFIYPQKSPLQGILQDAN